MKIRNSHSEWYLGFIDIKWIMNKFLLAGNRFMREMHLIQPGFTYSACGPFNKDKKRIQSLKKTQKIHDIFSKTN